MKRAVAWGVLIVLVLAGMGWYWFGTSHTRLTQVPAMPTPGPGRPAGLPKPPRSVIVVVEENKGFDEIIGDVEDAPYLNALAKRGALFTSSYGVAHPSQPNYFALFAGQTNGNGDDCPAAGIARDAPNLGAELIAARRTFRAYAEDLPSPGFPGCTSGEYARKHAPWTHFTNVPAQDSVPFSMLGSYDSLPNVAFIIPNLVHDMHSASVSRGDTWLRDHIDPLVRWADGHEALVIITWDESNGEFDNHIPTIFVGGMVKPGRYDEPVTHVRVLRTIEDLFGLAHAGQSAGVAPITDVWK